MADLPAGSTSVPSSLGQRLMACIPAEPACTSLMQLLRCNASRVSSCGAALVLSCLRPSCAATIAINPGGATKSYFDHTQDPVSADVGSRRLYAKDVLEGTRKLHSPSYCAITD